MLHAPIGDRTRPTTDAVRETIFSILHHHVDWDGLTVLDCYSGTGALGLEALSRGAAHCTFIDSSTAMCRSVDANARDLGLVERSSVICDDVSNVLRSFREPVDVIFCDPPYAARCINQIIRIVEERHLLTDNGLLIAEHDEREVVVPSPIWSVVASKKRGATVVDLLQYTLTASP